MKLLKGDKVIVISGKDKGKTGVIQKVDPKTNRIVVEGVNLRKKHKKPTRIGHKVVKGKKVRVAKASGTEL